MENWRRTFLKRMEQELQPYQVDSIFLEEEGINPDTLRQMFDIGQEDAKAVVMDIAVFQMRDGVQLLQIFTEILLDVEESVELLKYVNACNFDIPLGTMGYFSQERQLYHKYNQIVKEPNDLEELVQQTIVNIDLILGTVGAYYDTLQGIGLKIE